MIEFEKIIAQVEEELYNAIEALEQLDLPTVRGCAARAQSFTVEAWRVRNRRDDNDETALGNG